MRNVIADYLRNNGYNAKGLKEALDNHGDKRCKMTWCASTTNGTSGIVQYMGTKYYFHCIAPWFMCPDGEITVEIA